MESHDHIICTYISQRQRISVQHLTNVQVIADKEGEPIHIQGWCADNQSPRTLRADHIINIHDSLDEAQSYFDEIVEQLESVGIQFKTPQSSPRLSSPHTMDVCFTGFTKNDKSELMSLAESKDMMVRQSVTKHLDILCYGYNAGPKKLAQALDQGVMILNRTQFEHLLETGEVSEDV